DLRSGGGKRLGVGVAVGAGQGETEALDGADVVTLETDLAVVVDFGCGHRSVSQVTHQHTGAPVHKSLSEPLVQGVAQPVLDVTGLFAPMRRVFKPVFPVGDIGPGPDLADPVAERVDVARDVVA